MIGWFGSDIVDAVSDVASSAFDTFVDNVPGAKAVVSALDDFASGPLKDFARTAVGKVVLTAVSGGAYYAFAPTVGAQLAAVAFAIPGMAKGEGFAEAWTSGFLERVTALIKYFVSVGIPDDLAQGKAADVMKDAFAKLDEYRAQYNLDGLDVQALAARAGVREDAAALYLAQELGDMTIVTSRNFDPATGKQIPNPPTIQEKLRKIAEEQARRAIAAAQKAKAEAAAKTARSLQSHLMATGISVAADVRAAKAEQAAADRAASSSAPRTSTLGDVALGLTIAGAVGALYWWWSSR